MFIDHSAMRYLVNNPMLGERICISLLLFKEFYFEVVVKLGILNSGPDHLSRITNGEEHGNLKDNFPDENFLSVQIVDEYFVGIIEFLSTEFTPREFTTVQNKNLVVRVVDY
jgi:hypothetical protein